MINISAALCSDFPFEHRAARRVCTQHVERVPRVSANRGCARASPRGCYSSERGFDAVGFESSWSVDVHGHAVWISDPHPVHPSCWTPRARGPVHAGSTALPGAGHAHSPHPGESGVCRSPGGGEMRRAPCALSVGAMPLPAAQLLAVPPVPPPPESPTPRRTRAVRALRTHYLTLARQPRRKRVLYLLLLPGWEPEANSEPCANGAATTTVQLCRGTARGNRRRQHASRQDAAPSASSPLMTTP